MWLVGKQWKRQFNNALYSENCNVSLIIFKFFTQILQMLLSNNCGDVLLGKVIGINSLKDIFDLMCTSWDEEFSNELLNLNVRLKPEKVKIPQSNLKLFLHNTGCFYETSHPLFQKIPDTREKYYRKRQLFVRKLTTGFTPFCL